MSKTSIFQRHRSFLVLLSIVTAVRLFFGVYLSLGDDEAYYWEWGQHLDWSYLDHPPMTGWIGWLFSAIFGHHEFGVRIGPILIAALFLVLIYQFTRSLYGDDRIAFRAALLFSIIPLFSIGSFMLLPDAPLSLFWLLSLIIFYQIIKGGNANLWFVLGAVYGLGMLSKYNMFALPGCIGLFLVFSAKHRFWLLRIKTWLGLLLGLLIFSPVIIWNVQRGFPSFAYHLVERNQGFRFTWEPVQIFLVGQLGYLSPLAFFAALVVLYQLGKMAFKEKDEKALFLFMMAVPYLLVFSIAVALSPTGKPHWPMMGYMTLFCALPWFWEKKWRSGGWWMKIVSPMPVLVLSGAITLLLLTQSIYPVIQMAPRLDMTNELYGWPEAGRRIQVEYDRLSAEKPTVVFTTRYNVAAQVAFYTRDHLAAYSITGYNEQYDYWERGTLDRLPEGANGIYVANSRYKPAAIENFNFESSKTLPPVIVKRKGKIVRKIYIFLCYNYLGKDLKTTN